MKRIIFLSLALLFVLALCEKTTRVYAQNDLPELSTEYALVVWKYSGEAVFMERNDRGRFETLETGKLVRAFPAGSKSTLVHDGRIPEGIYRLEMVPDPKMDHAFRWGFYRESLPGFPEIYYVHTPSLDLNVLGLEREFYEYVLEFSLLSTVPGGRFTLVVLPGRLPDDQRERLRNARGVLPWLDEDALDAADARMKPVENFIRETRLIPTRWHFAEDGTWIIDDVVPSDVDSPGAGAPGYASK